MTQQQTECGCRYNSGSACLDCENRWNAERERRERREARERKAYQAAIRKMEREARA